MRVHSCSSPRCGNTLNASDSLPVFHAISARLKRTSSTPCRPSVAQDAIPVTGLAGSSAYVSACKAMDGLLENIGPRMNLANRLAFMDEAAQSFLAREPGRFTRFLSRVIPSCKRRCMRFDEERVLLDQKKRQNTTHLQRLHASLVA